MRAAISSIVHRSDGSRRRQWRAISRYCGGIVAGSAGASCFISSNTGNRCVNACTNVMPSDQISPAGSASPFTISGGS